MKKPYIKVYLQSTDEVAGRGSVIDFKAFLNFLNGWLWRNLTCLLGFWDRNLELHSGSTGWTHVLDSDWSWVQNHFVANVRTPGWTHWTTILSDGDEVTITCWVLDSYARNFTKGKKFGDWAEDISLLPKWLKKGSVGLDVLAIRSKGL